MIEFSKGDLLTADVEALVNTVNCVGIMGRGIALQVKNAFPENFKEYSRACRLHELEPGRMLVHETGSLTNPRYIINFPTKRHWKGRSRLADIESGLAALVSEVRLRGIQSIALPPLGCGLGGLQWTEVKPRIVDAFEDLPTIRVVVFEPTGAPARSSELHRGTTPRMTPGRAALVGLMQRYLGALMDPFVSLLEVHKLSYFMQQAGESLRLRFTKAPYGPYAENLRQVLSRVEGHLISGYGDGGDDPEKTLELVPGAVEDASLFLLAHPETRARFDRVAQLVEGFETSFGLELLSTVHWVGTHAGVNTEDEAVVAVQSWSERKQQFSESQIRLAWHRLQNLGWLPDHSQNGELSLQR
jgi:O-acetyl-ADP-ribose deacetylase (regulator of RNase III)